MKHYDTVSVAESLLTKLYGLNKVGLICAVKGSPPQEEEFFPSVSMAEDRIRVLLLDSNTEGFWVGAQSEYEANLLSLLHQLNEQRAFGTISSAMTNGKVWDLAF